MIKSVTEIQIMKTVVKLTMILCGSYRVRNERGIHRRGIQNFDQVKEIFNAC